MSCCHYHQPLAGADNAFTVDSSRITFGRGCLAEVGARAVALGMRRVALFTDVTIGKLAIFSTVYTALLAAGLEVLVYDQVQVEPTDASFKQAIAFVQEAGVDGFVSLGGGSVIDTAKAANLYLSHPVADFLDYVNAPVGAGLMVPGALKAHIACPTTSGTGSEVTGITIFDLLALGAKTGIAHPHLRPSEALIDPDCTDSLPASVVAASGLDVLSHALESYTARPYNHRPAPISPLLRPMSQGANPWSDLGCRECLRILGQNLVQAVNDPTDRTAREQVMWASTLAGIAFGNAGVHVPHGMSYAVSGLVRDYRPSAGYPGDEAMVPHGMSVILNAPAVFRFTAQAAPERHLEAAQLLGAEVRGAVASDAGEVLAQQLIRIMRAVDIPNGLAGVGFTADDIPDLTKGAYPQQRLLQNAPLPINQNVLDQLFRNALHYW